MSYDFLIVDGSVTVRAIIKRTIRLSGLPVGRIHEAGDGREALDVLSAHHVDLVLADLHPARPDAADLIGRILSEPATRAVPVVLLSAQPDLRVIDRLNRAGARGYLRKPLTPDAVRDAVTRILEPTHV